MSTINLVLAAAHMSTAVLLLYIMPRLADGRIGRNYFVGFRTSTSMASDENWLAVHRYGAEVMHPWALAMLTAGFITLFLPLTSTLMIFVAALLPLLLTLVPFFKILAYSRNL